MKKPTYEFTRLVHASVSNWFVWAVRIGMGVWGGGESSATNFALLEKTRTALSFRLGERTRKSGESLAEDLVVSFSHSGFPTVVEFICGKS